MEVLIPAEQFQGEVTGSLTTKFVRAQRLKQYGDEKKWMRRSRFVAREFATAKGLDTFSPATGAHTSNLLQANYLWMKRQAEEMGNKDENQAVMASIDVRDAFLQVEQSEPILVRLQNQSFVVNRNLPGQRLGAKHWFLHLQKFLKESMDFEFPLVQPCSNVLL